MFSCTSCCRYWKYGGWSRSLRRILTIGPLADWELRHWATRSRLPFHHRLPRRICDLRSAYRRPLSNSAPLYNPRKQRKDFRSCIQKCAEVYYYMTLVAGDFERQHLCASSKGNWAISTRHAMFMLSDYWTSQRGLQAEERNEDCIREAHDAIFFRKSPIFGA